MPCICGEVTCICFCVCYCRPQICFCQACILLKDRQQQAIIESPSKQNHSQNKPVFNQRKPTLGSTTATGVPKPSTNDDRYPTLIKQLNQPVPPLNSDKHTILKRQLSQPALSSNCDPQSPLKRRLSEPRKIPPSGKFFSEHTPIFHKNPSSSGGPSLSSVSNKDLYLPSTSKTGSSTAPSTSGLNKDFKSGNSTNSISKKVSTTSSDSNSSCANIEYIKKASDKALPSYELFSSRFTTPSSDDNNNRNFGSTFFTSQNQDTSQTSTDHPGRSAEMYTSLDLGTSGVNSASLCSNPGSQSLHTPDRVPLQLSPQENPLNLSLSADDKHKISILHSEEFSSRSPSPVPTKQQRMDTMEFSNIPTSEGDNQSAETFSGGSRGTFSTTQIPLSSDSTAEGSYPKTRSECTTSTPGSSAYTTCEIQNPSQYTDTRVESPMETEVFSNFDQNLISLPLSAHPTSGFFSTPQIDLSSQASATNVNTYCNDLNDGRSFKLRRTPLDGHNLQEIQNSQFASSDLNRFSETPEHEVFITTCEQTSLPARQSVIVCPSSELHYQSTSTFSACQATNQDYTPYQAQSNQASSSSFPPSMNLSEVGLLASQTSNETQTNPQASDYFQPISSDVNMVPASSIAPSTDLMESYAGSREHLTHHFQSSTLQSASSGIPPSQRTARHSDDETGENNYANRSKRK